MNASNKNSKTQNAFICKDIKKHPEYDKIMKIKDKSIQQRLLKCLENKLKNGFDLRQFIQKFEEDKEYHIVKIETKTKKDSTETYNLLYDSNGFKYFSKAKIDKYIKENNVPSEIPDTDEHCFIIKTSKEDFFVKDEKYIIYIPIEPIYINMTNLGNEDEPEFEDE